jgi:hypothetical protein
LRIKNFCVNIGYKKQNPLKSKLKAGCVDLGLNRSSTIDRKNYLAAGAAFFAFFIFFAFLAMIVIQLFKVKKRSEQLAPLTTTKY